MKRAELQNLVTRIGGPKLVGRACGGITSQAVNHWKQCPLAHVPVLVTLAAEKNVTRSDGTPYTCELIRPDHAKHFEVLRKLSTLPIVGKSA